jgi:hypothetical protein
MHPDVVGFNACPCGITSRRSAITFAKAVTPVITADKITARPAIERRIQLFEQVRVSLRKPDVSPGISDAVPMTNALPAR